jgi:hypothetical protein
MYCPNCDNQQASKDAHFCRNCGLQLAVDATLLAGSGGIVPDGGTSEYARLTPRQKGLRLSALLFVIGLVLIPLAFLFKNIFLDKMIYLLAPAMMLLLAGLIRATYAILLQEGEGVSLGSLFLSGASQKGSARLNPPAWNASLPTPRQVGMSNIISQDKGRSEMSAPPSATEHTTQLLDKVRPDSP